VQAVHCSACAYDLFSTRKHSTSGCCKVSSFLKKALALLCMGRWVVVVLSVMTLDSHTPQLNITLLVWICITDCYIVECLEEFDNQAL
jgi:hypothetical protein